MSPPFFSLVAAGGGGAYTAPFTCPTTPEGWQDVPASFRAPTGPRSHLATDASMPEKQKRGVEQGCNRGKATTTILFLGGMGRQWSAFHWRHRPCSRSATIRSQWCCRTPRCKKSLQLLRGCFSRQQGAHVDVVGRSAPGHLSGGAHRAPFWRGFPFRIETTDVGHTPICCIPSQNDGLQCFEAPPCCRARARAGENGGKREPAPVRSQPRPSDTSLHPPTSRRRGATCCRIGDLPGFGRKSRPVKTCRR